MPLGYISGGEMTTTLGIVYAFAVVIAVAGVWRARQLWRDETDELDDFSDHFRRTFIVRIGGVIGLVLFAPPLLLSNTGDDLSVVRVVSAAGVLLTMVMGTALYFSIRFLGRPRALIPPHLRGAPRSAEGRRRRGRR